MKQPKPPPVKPPANDNGDDESLDPVGPIRGAPAARTGSPSRPKAPAAHQRPPKAGQPPR